MMKNGKYISTKNSAIVISVFLSTVLSHAESESVVKLKAADYKIIPF